MRGAPAGHALQGRLAAQGEPCWRTVVTCTDIALVVSFADSAFQACHIQLA